MAYMVVKNVAKIVLVTFIILLAYNVICYSDEIFNKGVKINDMNSNKKIRKETDRYKIFITGANYIKITVKDTVTGKILNMIVDNTDFASFIASERGLRTDKVRRFIDNEAYVKFRDKEYVEYMRENEGKISEINLNNFEKFIGIGKEKAGKKAVEGCIFDQPMTLDQLGVRNESELIEKYFTFNEESGEGKLKKEYEEKKEISKNPAFIAMLIDLGYIVGRGCYDPILFIRKSAGVRP